MELSINQKINQEINQETVSIGHCVVSGIIQPQIRIGCIVAETNIVLPVVFDDAVEEFLIVKNSLPLGQVVIFATFATTLAVKTKDFRKVGW